MILARRPVSLSRPPLTTAGLVTSARPTAEAMPEQPNPRPYDPRPSDYHPDAPPTESRVYAEMAEDSARHFARTFGTLGDPPIRYCAAEDLGEAIDIRRGELARIVALRLKHDFCRTLASSFGISGVGMWESVAVSHLDTGLFAFAAWVSTPGGFQIQADTDGYGAIVPLVHIAADGRRIGTASTWEEATALYAAHREGMGAAPPLTVWLERKAKEEEIAAAFVDFEGPRRKAAATVARAYGVAPSTVRRYVERVAARAVAQAEQDDAREMAGE